MDKVKNHEIHENIDRKVIIGITWETPKTGLAAAWGRAGMISGAKMMRNKEFSG